MCMKELTINITFKEPMNFKFIAKISYNKIGNIVSLCSLKRGKCALLGEFKFPGRVSQSCINVRLC